MEHKNKFSSTEGLKSKKGPIIIGLVIIVVILLILFFIGTSGDRVMNQENIDNETSSGELTEEERNAIINQLEEGDEAGSELSEEERAAIINQLEEEDTDNEELTEEERNAIMESLNN